MFIMPHSFALIKVRPYQKKLRNQNEILPAESEKKPVNNDTLTFASIVSYF